ncbi:rCG30103 [Rattus norvegicus]|uniref:RCG30103 n=1 Tax=Rattus norvegicus TaxID=10116 RepID=A6IL36_RAT|nr:rCG30103 [Rattus norvegicus]
MQYHSSSLGCQACQSEALTHAGQDNSNSKRHLGIMTTVLTCPSILGQKGPGEGHAISQIVVSFRRG